MKESSLTETHLIRVNLIFHQVNLVVKFPCEIVLALRNYQNKLISETAPRTLTQGCCQINQQLELQWQCPYDVGRSLYTQSLIQITIQVHSNNGTITAGFCNCEVTRCIKRAVIPLKKCSDKSATLTFSSNFQFLQIVSDKQYLNTSKSSANISINNSVNQSLRKMKSVAMINDSSQLSISKISINHNTKLQNYLRGQNEQLHRQNQILRDKMRNSDRKEKELLQQLKETLIKYDKLNNKFTEYDNLQQVNQIIVVQKDRTIKGLEVELRKVQDREKKLDQQVRLGERKFDIKEQALMEQLRRANQKNNNLQSELQSITYAQTGLLTKYQQIQKNGQQSLKQKQRAYFTQKTRILKQVSEKQIQIMKLLKQNEKLKEIVDDHESKPIRKDSGHIYDILQQKNKQIDALSKEYTLIKLQKQNIEDELQQFRRTSEDKMNLRRRLNQAMSECNQLKLQIDKVTGSYELKMKEQSNKLQELEKEKRKNQEQLKQKNSFSSNKQSKLEELEKQSNKYQTANAQLIQKYKDIKQKYQETHQKLRENQFEWSSEIQAVLAEKQRLQNQNHDLRWELDREASTIREMQLAIQQLKKNNFELKQQMVVQEEKTDNMEIFKKEIDALKNSQKEELEVKEGRLKELQKQIGQKSMKIQSQERKVVQKQKEISEMKKRMEEITNKQKQINQQQQIRQEQYLKERIQSKEQIQKLKQQIIVKQQDCQIIKKQLQGLADNIEGLSGQNAVLSQQNITLSSNLIYKESQYRQLNDKLTQLQRDSNIIANSFAQQSSQRKGIQVQLETYKQQMREAVRWVLCLLGRQEIILEEETVLFPDSTLCSLELDAIKNRNLLLQKMKNGYNAMKEEKQFISFQLQKIGQQLMDTEYDYEQIIQKQRQDRRKQEEDFIQEKYQLFSQIEEGTHKIEEIRIENQKYFKEKKLLQHQLEEAERDHQASKQAKNQIQTKFKQVEKKCQSLQQQIKTIKRDTQLRESSFIEEREFVFMQQKQRLQTQNHLLQKQLSKRQQQLSNKEQKLKIVEQKLLLMDSEKRKIQFDMSVNQQLLKQAYDKKEQLKKLKQQKIQIIQQLQHQLDIKVKEVSQKQIELYEHSTKQIDLEHKINTVNQYQQEMEHAIKQLEKDAGIKAEQLKEWKINLRELQDSSNRQKQSMREEISRLTGQIDIYRLLLQKSQSKIQTLTKQTQKLQSQLQVKKESLLKIESDSQMMQKQIYFEQSHKNSIERDYDELTINYEHAKQQIYHLQQQKLLLQKQIQILKGTIRNKQKQAEQALQNSRLRVSKEFDDLRKKYDLESMKVYNAEEKCEEFKSDIKQLEKALDRKEFDILTIQQEKEKIKCQFQEELQRMQSIIDKNQQKVQQINMEHNEEKEQLGKQIQHLTHQIIQLSNQLQAKEQQIDQLHKMIDQHSQKMLDVQNQLKAIQSSKSIQQNQKLQALQKQLIILKGININADQKDQKKQVNQEIDDKQQEGHRITGVLNEIGSGRLRLKLNLLDKVESIQDKKEVIDNYFQFQEKLDKTLKMHKVEVSM